MGTNKRFQMGRGIITSFIKSAKQITPV